MFPSLQSVSTSNVSLKVLTHWSLQNMTVEDKKTYLVLKHSGSSVGSPPHFGYAGVLNLAAHP